MFSNKKKLLHVIANIELGKINQTNISNIINYSIMFFDYHKNQKKYY
jgi:hypothetical protein